MKRQALTVLDVALGCGDFSIFARDESLVIEAGIDWLPG
jgi:hypothetical protein